jgi:hypothetical protein
MTTRTFDVHGVTVKVTSDIEHHLRRLDCDFGTFAVDAIEDPQLRYEVVHAPISEDDRHAALTEGPLGDVVSRRPDRALRISGPRVDEPTAYVQEVRSYFAASVFSALVSGRRAQQIHASAVEGTQGGVAFVGAKKAGKSSTALLSLTAGADFVSNDITFLDATTSEVRILGIPQAVTLGPGASRWFSANAPEVGVPAPESRGEASAEAEYNTEGPAKYEVSVATVRTFTGVRREGVRLDHLVFPEPGMWLSAPRAVEIRPGEAMVRLLMSCEAMFKWGWPPALVGEHYLERLSDIVRCATEQASCWLFQWCPDHHANRDLLRKIVL